ncbi:MAG: cation transporter [Thiobacillus sp.]|uniref:cation transporter n=1 Tax=Thiobacillus sp. TaxID=924 RepID=UPI0027349749|nr:cation transporter [Thiobacillus sp.]MDP3583793.1 cation transporter [Thiobacillus sp.]
MSGCGCDSVCGSAPPDPRYRRALWIALVLNALMFFVEIFASFAAQSVSLLADAVDFLGDAANYGVALFVLGLAPVWRSRTALWKGWLMVGFGVFVLGKSAWQWSAGVVPEPFIMGWVSLVALAVNVGVAALLYAHRQGDAQARSVWLCSRNDALGNLAVMGAAGGVWATAHGWPDIAVALLLAWLALSSGVSVIQHAQRELRVK